MSWTDNFYKAQDQSNNSLELAGSHLDYIIELHPGKSPETGVICAILSILHSQQAQLDLIALELSGRNPRP